MCVIVQLIVGVLDTDQRLFNSFGSDAVSYTHLYMGMREMKYLKVSADIARRAGVIDVRHRTADGDFIINESDLRMVRFLSLIHI